jgi:hypothetical protein
MSVYIRVPIPCPATWAAMAPAPGGRHCSICHKVVVDFARMTDAEVLAALGHSSSLCGRFRPEQLGSSSRLRKATANWAGWLTAAAVVLSSCDAPNPAHIKLRTAPNTTESSAFVARGRVVDKYSGKPLAGAHITSQADSTLHTRSGADGRFEIKLPPHLRDSLLYVAYDAKSFDDRDYICRREKPGNEMLIRLREHPGTLGEFTLEQGETGLGPPTGPPPPPPVLVHE